MTRYVTRREQADFYGFIALGLFLLVRKGVAHMFGSHRWCEHVSRHRTHRGIR